MQPSTGPSTSTARGSSVRRVSLCAATIALAGLPEEQRRAIHARVVHDREYAEIAGELRCSEAVVRQRVSRGLRTLRARLAGEQ